MVPYRHLHCLHFLHTVLGQLHPMYQHFNHALSPRPTLCKSLLIRSDKLHMHDHLCFKTQKISSCRTLGEVPLRIIMIRVTCHKIHRLICYPTPGQAEASCCCRTTCRCQDTGLSSTCFINALAADRSPVG